MNKIKNMISAMKKGVFCGLAAVLLLLVLPVMIHGEELQLDEGKLLDFLKEKIIEKVDEVFIDTATSAEGAVRDATYFNEILRDFGPLGLHETNFAQSAFELYRGYLEALEKDEKESDPEKKTNAQDFMDGKVKGTIETLVTGMLDEPSQEIVGSLKGLYADISERMKKIAEAEKAAENPELPETEYAKILLKAGITGDFIDDLEYLESNYLLLKDMTADYVEAYNALETMVGALKSRDPGNKIETLFDLGAQYGGKIPVLGMFVQKYFEVAKEMVKACKGLGKIIRKREGNCVGGETTGQMDTSHNDPRNFQWSQQFSDREACPEGEKGIYLDIYKDVHNNQDIFFWVGKRFIAGEPHGGMDNLRALIQWLRRMGYNAQATDVAFLAEAYNVRPGFLQSQKEVREKAVELQSGIHRLVNQLLCDKETTDEFLLKDMGIEGILEELGIDTGLVRSFPCVDEIVDKVIEGRLIKGLDGFYSNLLDVLGRVKNTMAFRIQGRVTDDSGKGLEKIALEASPESRVIDDCSSITPDAQGNFRITCVKSPSESLGVQIKATNVDDEVEEATVNASGTGDEYKCEIVFDVGKIVSLVITPEEKTLEIGGTVTFKVLGVLENGESEPIAPALIKWGNAANGVFTAKKAGTFTVTAEFLKIGAAASVIVEEPVKEEPEEVKNLDEALEELQDDS